MSDFSPSGDELAYEGSVVPDDLESLMLRYQGTDSEAGSLLVERLSPNIFRYFLGHLRNRTAAEDLLQDFWLRIHHARRTYRPGQPVLPWLYSIAHRVRVDNYRRNRHALRDQSLDDSFLQVASPEPAEPNVNVSELLAQLPDSQREVLLMMKVNGLTLEEVARCTGSTVGSVKQKAHRAYEKLRGLMGRSGEGRNK